MEVRIGHEQLKFILDQQFLKALDQFHEERVGDIGNDCAINLAFSVL